MPSIHQQVVGQIKNIGRGNIFFPEQFEHLGSPFHALSPPEYPPKDVLAGWRDDYEKMQSSMIYGKSLPIDAFPFIFSLNSSFLKLLPALRFIEFESPIGHQSVHLHD